MGTRMGNVAKKWGGFRIMGRVLKNGGVSKKGFSWKKWGGFQKMGLVAKNGACFKKWGGFQKKRIHYGLSGQWPCAAMPKEDDCILGIH